MDNGPRLLDIIDDPQALDDFFKTNFNVSSEDTDVPLSVGNTILSTSDSFSQQGEHLMQFSHTGTISANTTPQVVTVTQPVLQQQQQQQQQLQTIQTGFNGSSVQAVAPSNVSVQRQPQNTLTLNQAVTSVDSNAQPQIISVNVSGALNQPQNIYVQRNPTIAAGNVGQTQTLQTITIGGKTYLIPQSIANTSVANVAIQNVGTQQVSAGSNVTQQALNVGGIVPGSIVPVQTVRTTQNVTQLQQQQGNSAAITNPGGQTITVNAASPQLATQFQNVAQQISVPGTALQQKIGQQILTQQGTLVTLPQLQQASATNTVTTVGGRQIRLPGQVQLANTQISRTPTLIQPKQPVAISPKTHVNISPKPAQITIGPKGQMTLQHGSNLTNQPNNIQVIQNAAVANALRLQNQGTQDKSAVGSPSSLPQQQNIIVNSQGVPIQNIVRTISVSNVLQSTRTTTATVGANQVSVAGIQSNQSLAQPIMSTTSTLQASPQVQTGHAANPQVPLAALTVAQQIQYQAQQQKLQQQQQIVGQKQPQAMVQQQIPKQSQSQTAVSSAIIQPNLQKQIQDLNFAQLIKSQPNVQANIQPKPVQQQLQQPQSAEQQQQGQTANFSASQVQPPVAVVQPQLNSKQQQGNLNVQQQQPAQSGQVQVPADVQQLIQKREQHQQLLYQQALKIQKEKQQQVQIMQPQQLQQPQQVQLQNVQAPNTAQTGVTVHRVSAGQQTPPPNTIVISSANLQQLQQQQLQQQQSVTQLQPIQQQQQVQQNVQQQTIQQTVQQTQQIQQPVSQSQQVQQQQIQQPVQQQQQQLQVQQAIQQPLQMQQQQIQTMQRPQQQQQQQQQQQVQQVQVQQQMPQKLQIPLTPGQQQQAGKQTVYQLNLTSQQRLQVQNNIHNQIKQLLAVTNPTPQQKQLLNQLTILQQRLSSQGKQNFMVTQTTTGDAAPPTTTPQQAQPNLTKLLTQTPVGTTHTTQTKQQPLTIRTVATTLGSSSQVTAATSVSAAPNIVLPEKLQISTTRAPIAQTTSVVAPTVPQQATQTSNMQTPVKTGQIITLTPQQKLTVKQIQEQIKTMTPEQQQQFYKHQQALLLRIQQAQGGRAVAQKQQPLIAKVSGVTTTTQAGAPLVTVVKQQAPVGARVPIQITQVGKGINQIKTLAPAIIAPQQTQTVQQALQQRQQQQAQLQFQTKGIKRPAETQLTKASLLMQELESDQNSVLNPSFVPFKSRDEAVKRLMKYHVLSDRGPDENKVKRADEIFETVSEQLLEKMDRMLRKYRLLLFDEAQRTQPSAEMVMIERMFIQDEKLLLQKEKQEKQALTSPVPISVVKQEKLTTSTSISLAPIKSSVVATTNPAVGVATATTAYLQQTKPVTSLAKVRTNYISSSVVSLAPIASTSAVSIAASTPLFQSPLLSSSVSLSPVTIAAVVSSTSASIQVVGAANTATAGTVFAAPVLQGVQVTPTASTVTTPAKIAPIVSPTIKPASSLNPAVNNSTTTSASLPLLTAASVTSAISTNTRLQQEAHIVSSSVAGTFGQSYESQPMEVDLKTENDQIQENLEEKSPKVKLKTESDSAVEGILDNPLCNSGFEMIDIESLSPMETHFTGDDGDEINEMFGGSLDGADSNMADDVFVFDTDKFDTKVPDIPEHFAEAPRPQPLPRLLLKSEPEDDSFADGILNSPAPELLNEQMQSAISSILDLQRPPTPQFQAARKDSSMFDHMVLQDVKEEEAEEGESAVESLLQGMENPMGTGYGIPSDNQNSPVHSMLEEEDFLANTGNTMTEEELSVENLLAEQEPEDPALEEAIKSIMM